MTEAEFDALLEQLHGKSAPSAGSQASTEETQTSETPESPKESPDVLSAAAQTEEISETEFDALLDELHGKGKKISGDNPTASPVAVEDAKQGEGGSVASSENDFIGDSEFDALLDDLHGAGKAPGKPASGNGTSGGNSSGASSAVSKGQASPPASTAAASAPKKVSPQPTASVKPSAPAPAPAPKRAAVAPKVEPKGAAAKRPSRDAPVAAETTVRVDTKRLDDIMNMVGELVLVRNRLVRLGLKSNDEAMSRAVANLDVVTADLQMSVMKTRMQPIKKVFGRFPRVVRDLARNLKKEINLELQGEETDLDKNLVEALADPLVHLVRNSVDHGVEMPDVREAMGKSRSGKITLAAQQEGDHIVLSITDDGGGMDAAVLKSKAVEKGLMDEEAAERLSETEAFNLIFHPGFSTKEQVSDVSGRGVGMDVVKTKISQLNGTIDVQSVKGEGTQIAIKVPLTLAIMPTLMVMLGCQTFALPLVSVNEIFHMDLSQTNVVDGQEVVIVREKALPLFHLKKWLITEDAGDSVKESAHVVIVSVATQKVGFVVDALIGQEEVVIKPLGKMLHGTPGMAGATITGDGRIALILDVPSMLRKYANHT
ncbi:MAG: chemotaxis protein CheA [Moraxellaceae bacterium]|nr:MAG: chemotaxis protein CheA [Moraxellaceae bacterium]